jgi:signal recognition particle subunit SRP54
VFDSLSDRLRKTLADLTGRGRVSEADVDTALREIRLSLLEADVTFKVVKDFIGRVRERAVGAEILQSLTAGQQVVKIVNDELVALLGGGDRTFHLQGNPAVIALVGLQGSGKTTSAAKLARYLVKQGRRPLLVAADPYRPAAADQLETLGKQLEIPVYAERDTQDVVRIARHGIDEARRARDRVVIVDTAGRLQIDEEMMAELERLKDTVHPDEILLVADGMTGQDAVKIAKGFDDRLGVTGVVLTKMDGDARGGAALSIYGVTRKPIKYVGVGEKLDALDEFHPERMAGRILQMGDIVSLVEKAQGAFDADEAKRLEKKVRKEGMDLQDFLGAMKQIQKMGPLESILGMLPGVNMKALKQAKVDPKRMRHLEAIVLSMTPEERQRPSIINGSRRARIAKGAGRPISEVNKLLDQFRDMQKMMKKMAKGGMKTPPSMFGMR